MKYTVCVVSGSRAEYGLLRPLLHKFIKDDSINLKFVLTGSHLSNSFGNTQREIEKDAIPIDARIELPLDSDTSADMARATGTAVIKFADYFEAHRPDILVMLGDRFEVFAAATAAAMQSIPIAHLHGGETTQGAADEFMRHSITKMSTLHFVACEEYRRRVIQLGETPERVYNVGALGVENALKLELMTIESLQDSLRFELAGKEYCVVTFHPVTLEQNTYEAQMLELTKAMDAFPDMLYIITKANADAGGRAINQIWDEQAQIRSNWLVVSSLGVARYLSALKYAKMMLGNSSSGILEAPAMKIPTVNIGDRQKGRMMGESVICCKPVSDCIIDAMQTALSAEFQNTIKHVANPFGDGHTSEKVVEIIRNWLGSGEISVKKEFYDIGGN